ncbi:MAG TPA: hypothetical protein VGQ83_36730 [Polyangia bacterium]|jgi:hypothetical protein
MGEPLKLHGRRVFPDMAARLRAVAGEAAAELRIGEFTFYWPEGPLDEEGARALLGTRALGMPLELLPIATSGATMAALYVSPLVGAADGDAERGFPVVMYLPEERAATPVASSVTGLLHFAFACCRDAAADPAGHHVSTADARRCLEAARRLDAALGLGHRFELELPDPEAAPIRWHAAFLGFDPEAPYSLAVEAQRAAERREVPEARRMLARAAAQAPWFAPIHIAAALLELEAKAIPDALWSFYRALAVPAHGSGETTRSPFYGLPLAFEVDLDPMAFCHSYRASAPADLRAAPFWELLLEGDPTNPAAWLATGRALAARGRDRDARMALLVAHDLQLEAVAPLEELGALAARGGDWLLATTCDLELDALRHAA